jgi:hypothetical protein
MLCEADVRESSSEIAALSSVFLPINRSSNQLFLFLEFFLIPSVTSLCIYECSVLLINWSSSAAVISMLGDVLRLNFSVEILTPFKPGSGTDGSAV